jgi:hypothetical protein
MTEIEQLKQRIELLENFVADFVYSDRYISQKHFQFIDGKNIQLAKSTGTQIGTAADQKLAFHGATPVVQASAISAPTSPGATYSQAEASSVVVAVNSIRTVLANKGLTA